MVMLQIVYQKKAKIRLTRKDLSDVTVSLNDQLNTERAGVSFWTVL